MNYLRPPIFILLRLTLLSEIPDFENEYNKYMQEDDLHQNQP